MRKSNYNIFGWDGKQNVRRKSDTEMHVKNLRPTIEYEEGNQIVWGCMANSGVCNLDFIDGTMNKYVYLDILKRNLMQSVCRLGISEHVKLYLDNDPKHTADICKLWILYHCPSVIKTPALNSRP
ncbi:transposable element Tcb2 transposase [Trichonephila clavipes]|uniref:Transposable element Tcb2 transposase n=1 Tax=Trichonephila clavipes TaxID=2585209 RepID=A0A8X6RZX6_TRICX|nr:transposable element Tcb2 transposase [Trichonephila clavipes]